MKLEGERETEKREKERERERIERERETAKWRFLSEINKCSRNREDTATNGKSSKSVCRKDKERNAE